MVHDDQEPLRDDLAVGAPELGHVGVHGQLLAGKQDVGVDDRGHDHLPAVQRPGRPDEAFVAGEWLDAVGEDLVAVRVRLAEVVRAGRSQ